MKDLVVQSRVPAALVALAGLATLGLTGCGSSSTTSTTSSSSTTQGSAVSLQPAGSAPSTSSTPGATAAAASSTPAGGTPDQAALVKALTSTTSAGRITSQPELAAQAQKMDPAAAIEKMQVSPASCRQQMVVNAKLVPATVPLAVGTVSGSGINIQLRTLDSTETARAVLDANKKFVESCPTTTMTMGSVKMTTSTALADVTVENAQDAIGTRAKITGEGIPVTEAPTAMAHVGSVLINVSATKGGTSMAEVAKVLDAVAKNIPTS